MHLFIKYVQYTHTSSITTSYYCSAGARKDGAYSIQILVVSSSWPLASFNASFVHPRIRRPRFVSPSTHQSALEIGVQLYMYRCLRAMPMTAHRGQPSCRYSHDTKTARSSFSSPVIRSRRCCARAAGQAKEEVGAEANRHNHTSSRMSYSLHRAMHIYTYNRAEATEFPGTRAAQLPVLVMCMLLQNPENI